MAERRSGGVKGRDGSAEDLDRETGEEQITVGGHVERMADERLPKRAAELREQGKRRRGRPRLRWEDCVKIDVKKAGEEGDWKKKIRDRGGWKLLSDEAVKKLRAAPHPRQREKEEERERGAASVLELFQAGTNPMHVQTIYIIQNVFHCVRYICYIILIYLFI